jgi:hypothetical protein
MMWRESAREGLEERLAQLSGVWVADLIDDAGFSAKRARERIPAGIGEITRKAGSTNLQPREVATLIRAGWQSSTEIFEDLRFVLGAGSVYVLGGTLAKDLAVRGRWSWKGRVVEIAQRQIICTRVPVEDTMVLT